MYLDEGHEDMLLQHTEKHLRIMVNRTTNAVFNGKHHPSYWSQADVRKAGQRLVGAFDLAVDMVGHNGRQISPDLCADTRKAIRDAMEFSKKEGAR